MEQRRRSRVKSKKKTKFLNTKAYLLIIEFLVVVLLVAVLYAQVIKPIKESHRPLSFLIVGSDISEVRDEKWGGTKPEYTDSMTVLTFNPNNLTFEATSIPRDTSVDYMCPSNNVPQYQDKINELYYISGGDMGCVTKTVENLLNIPIDYYAKINMDQFLSIIDEIGPVKITAHAADGYLFQPSIDDSNAYQWVDGEVYEMMGEEALMYSRARSDSEKDYGRGLRQQQVIAATLKEALDAELSLGLVNDILKIIDTDVPPLLGAKYYEFLVLTNEIGQQILSGDVVNQDVLSTDSWLDLFAYLDYDAKRVNDNIIAEFQVYLTTHDNAEELVKEYFFKSHQFYNETYSNHYNVVEEQLQTISDALRANLQLKQEPVTMPNLAYGNNRANGLIPKQERVETDNDEVIVEDNDDDIIEDDPTITDPDEIIDDEDAIDDEIDEEFPIDPDGPNDPDNPDDDTENPDPENPDDGIETPDPDDPDDGIETPDPDVDPENPTDPATP